MYHSDQKILQLIEILKSKSIIRFNYQFCDHVGILRQNYFRVKKGHTHFTPLHIESVCQKYNVNANWIFGTQNNVFNHSQIPLNTLVEVKGLPATPTMVENC